MRLLRGKHRVFKPCVNLHGSCVGLPLLAVLDLPFQDDINAFEDLV